MPRSSRSPSTDDKATGVTLKNGETLSAKTIISAINPKTTFLDLVGPRHLDTGMVRRAGNILMRGNAVKLHLALKGTPDFKGADLKTRLVIAPSVRAVEDAFNPVKYGEFSENPVMEIVIPSAFEEGLAPKGHHVLSAIVQYAPVTMDAKARDAFLKRIMATLETYAPGIGKLVVKSNCSPPKTSKNNTASSAATGTMANLPPSKCCSSGPSSVPPNMKPQSPAFGSLVPAPIPAAAFPVRLAGTRPSEF